MGSHEFPLERSLPPEYFERPPVRVLSRAARRRGGSEGLSRQPNSRIPGGLDDTGDNQSSSDHRRWRKRGAATGSKTRLSNGSRGLHPVRTTAHRVKSRSSSSGGPS